MANNRVHELSPLEDLPILALEVIDEHLSPQDRANLALTSKTMLNHAIALDLRGKFDKSLNIDYKSSTCPLFFNSRLHAMYRNLQIAGMAILKGSIEAALSMIDRYPALLLHRIPSITLKKYPTHAGETHINRTLYQLALGTCYFELYNAIGDRIQKYYGRDVRVKQFNEQFPNGLKSRVSYSTTFDCLIKIIAEDSTINLFNDKNIMNATTRVALRKFRKQITTNKHTTGVHFDLQIFIDFIEVFKNSSNEFKNEIKAHDQRALYWRCGFGILESCAPYFIAMVLSRQEKAAAANSTLIEDGTDFFDERLGDQRCIINGIGDGYLWGQDHAFAIKCLENAGFLAFCQTQLLKLEQQYQEMQSPINERPKKINRRCQLI